MILALSYCLRDASLALRLFSWMEFLSQRNNNSLKTVKLVIITSKLMENTIKRRNIQDVILRTFGEVIEHFPPEIYEKGWPASANWSFKKTIEYVESNYHDDMLWVEPDIVPVVPDWYEKIKDEWEQKAIPAGKNFMGARVPHSRPHMTGNAVYGKDWRRYAPSLVNTYNGAFDTNAAEETLPNAYITALIQQVWRPNKITLDLIASETVLFHQDKTGQMIELLQRKYFGGGFQHQIINTPVEMTYFKAFNASHPVKTHGKSFKFLRTNNVAGIWSGVYATNDEVEITQLSLTRGVSEINKEEYDRCVKMAPPQK